jgi:hypothetical protein
VIGLLDPRVWLACAALAVGGFAAGYAKRWAGESERWEARIRDAERAAAMKLIRTFETQQEAVNRAQDQTQAAQRDAAAAGHAADRLRERTAELTKRARASCPSKATGDPIGVLADVLGRADARAGILAEYADRARIAGQLCEQSYEALRR